jgi:hypothetical protein
MSDQTLVDPSLDGSTDRSNSVSTPTPRRMWPSINRLRGVLRKPSGLSDIAVGATPSASRFSAPGREQEFRVGGLLYLLCVAVVAAATIGAFFGAGLYSLGHSYRNVISDSGAKCAPAVLTTQPDATSQALGVSAEHDGEPVEGRGESHSEPKRFAMASTEIVSGTVTQVTDAMTWVVGNKTVYLWGIRPGAHYVLPSLEKVADWVRARGPLECRKQAHSSRYRCSTSAGDDVGEAALLAGVARAARGALPAYHDAEEQARRRGNGL